MPHASHRPATLGRKRAAASVLSRVSFRLAVAMLIAMSLAVLMSEADEISRSSNASSRSIGVATQTIKLPIVDGNDIRFARLSGSQGLSQVRVSEIIQDDQGIPPPNAMAKALALGDVGGDPTDDRD